MILTHGPVFWEIKAKYRLKDIIAKIQGRVVRGHSSSVSNDWGSALQGLALELASEQKVEFQWRDLEIWKEFFRHADGYEQRYRDLKKTNAYVYMIYIIWIYDIYPNVYMISKCIWISYIHMYIW